MIKSVTRVLIFFYALLEKFRKLTVNFKGNSAVNEFQLNYNKNYR